MNKLLTDAWTKYAASLETDDVLELSAGYSDFVAQALEDVVKAKPDAEMA